MTSLLDGFLESEKPISREAPGSTGGRESKKSGNAARPAGTGWEGAGIRSAASRKNRRARKITGLKGTRKRIRMETAANPVFSMRFPVRRRSMPAL